MYLSNSILINEYIFETIRNRYTAEIQRQLEESNAKAVIGTPKTYAALKEAVQNIKRDIKVICIQTDANESIPSGAINFADLIDTSSKCFVFAYLPIRDN